MDHPDEYYDDYTAYNDAYDAYNVDASTHGTYYDEAVYDQAVYQPIAQKKEEKYSVLSMEDVIERIKETVDDITECTGAHRDIVLAVLVQNNFNKDKSMYGILDSPQSTLTDAGVDRWGNGVEWSSLPALLTSFASYSPPNNPNTASSSITDSVDEVLVPCKICWDDIPSSLMLTSPCGHGCCSECWASHAQAHLSVSSALKCYAEGCRQTVPWTLLEALSSFGHSCTTTAPATIGGDVDDRKDDSDRGFDSNSNVVVKSVTDNNKNNTINSSIPSSSSTTNPTVASGSCPACAASLFLQSLAKSYIHTSPTLKWCLQPGCNHIITAPSLTSTVKCDCGLLFCFSCDCEQHTPASCAEMRKWKDLGKTENKNVQWIMNNTHKCPKCGVRIEKDSGCNHMTCTSCKYEFCWICNGDWIKHMRDATDRVSAYICNKFDPDILLGKETQASDDSSDLQRYLFYYSRAVNHMVSAQFARNNRAVLEKRLKTVSMKKSRLSSRQDEVEDMVAVGASLLQANEVLIECKRVLQYSYTHAFCLPDRTSEKALFEYQQSELEMAAESLTQTLHTFKDQSSTVSTVMNAMRVCQESMKSFLQRYAE